MDGDGGFPCLRPLVFGPNFPNPAAGPTTKWLYWGAVLALACVPACVDTSNGLAGARDAAGREIGGPGDPLPRADAPPFADSAAGTDPPEPSCADGTCAPEESCSSCTNDRGACSPSCGDGFCGVAEDCSSCADDCGSCMETSCGDNLCDSSEHCSTCEADCGGCADAAASMVRGPYLQMGTQTGITIRWRSSASTDSVVAFGTSPERLPGLVHLTESTTDHVVPITGLAPETKYYYAIGQSDAPLVGGDNSHSFTTSPATDRPTRIWVLGDSGTANNDARNVRDAFYTFTGDRGADLWLMLGDNAYSDGTDDEFQEAVFDMYPASLASAVLWPTLGNHDGHTADSASQDGPYYEIFSMPANGEGGGASSGTEAYYGFNYGNIHFVCLDSYDTDRSESGAMMTWLENDLAANTQEWLIAFWHHPPYSHGSHNSDSDSRMSEMREIALPILESYGVDLVLSGHSHSYERSVYLHGHYGESDTLNDSMIMDSGDGRPSSDGAYQRAGSSSDGAVYIVAGSSGKTSSADLDHPAMLVSLLRLGSLVIDVNGNQLDVHFLDDSGETADSFTIGHE